MALNISDHTVKIMSDRQKLDVPSGSVKEIEDLIRKRYPGIQIRYFGLMYGKFPHPKRSPYIALYVDGCGLVIGADLRTDPPSG